MRVHRFSTAGRIAQKTWSSGLLGMAAVVLIITASCSGPAKIFEYPPLIDFPFDYKINSVPVIVVGTIQSHSRVGEPHSSRWEQGGTQSGHLQLNRIIVRVENVLKGSGIPHELPVYYYVDLGIKEGPPIMGMADSGGTWHIGDRKLFVLQSDAGVLRTVCDNWERCVPGIFTGAHPNLSESSGRPLGELIADFLLTRGQDCTDEGIIKSLVSEASLAYGYSKDYAVQRLQSIAATDHPGVRQQACEILRSMGQPCSRSAQVK